MDYVWAFLVGGALAAIVQRRAKLPLSCAEMAAGKRHGLARQPRGTKAGRHAKAFGHGAARAVQPRKGHIQCAHGIGAGRTLRLQIPCKNKIHPCKAGGGFLQNQLHGPALQIAFGGFPAGFAQGIVRRGGVQLVS